MTLLVNVMRFYFKCHCYVNLFGGFYAFISGSESQVIEAWNEYEISVVYFGCLFGF